MRDKPSLQDLLEVQTHFKLPSPVLVEKDWYVVRALAAINIADVKPFRLVFSGGSALSRAHRLIRRMSEDIDLKIVSDEPRSRPELRKLREIITGALLSAGFQFNPENSAHRNSANASRYTIYRLPYTPEVSGEAALRPEIQIETAVWPLRLQSVERSVTSFWGEAFKRPPEVQSIPCVALVETIAEKFVALTRRAGAELADAGGPRDKTLVRHVLRGMSMSTKRSATTKKAIRKRKLKSAGRKVAEKKRRAVARKPAAPKKPRTAVTQAPSAAAAPQVVAPVEPPIPSKSSLRERTADDVVELGTVICASSGCAHDAHWEVTNESLNLPNAGPVTFQTVRFYCDLHARTFCLEANVELPPRLRLN